MGWKPYQPRVKWTTAGVRRAPVEYTGKPVSNQSLAHPDLQGLSNLEFEIRSSVLSRLINRIPSEDWINWYGGLIRPGGGNGMYATEALADNWPHRTLSDHTAGPR